MDEIRVIVVDDERIHREGISLLLSNCPGVCVIKECSQGEEAVVAILGMQPDIVFLDVQMPLMNGFDVIRVLPAASVPVIIFVTAFDKHALEAFEVNAVDYLLKPFTDERFFKALERGKLQLKKTNDTNDGVVPLVQYLQNKPFIPAYQKRMMVKDGGKIIFLQTEEIIWIEAADYYVVLHFADKSHVIREAMSNLELKLDPEQFVRIHRSSIVNISYIKELQPYGKEDYRVILRNNKQLKMGRSWLKKLESKLGRYS